MRQQPVYLRRSRLHTSLVQDMQVMSDTNIIQQYGAVRIGYRTARQGGCCVRGTRSFIELVKRLQTRKYGKPSSRSTITVRELFALKDDIRIHTNALTYWALLAIAAAFILEEEKREHGI